MGKYKRQVKLLKDEIIPMAIVITLLVLVAWAVLKLK